jgi:hypothetical protein
VPKGFGGALGGAPETSLEFCEGVFDRLEVRGVFGQVEQAGTGGFDGLSDFVALMRAEIVENDDVASLEGWTQDLLDIGQEPGPVDRPIQHHGRRHLMMAQSSKESGGLPARKRDLVDQPLAARAAAVQAGHVVLGPRLVDEHQLFSWQLRLLATPCRSSFGDVRPILLGGAQAFFISLLLAIAEPPHRTIAHLKAPLVRPARAASPARQSRSSAGSDRSIISSDYRPPSLCEIERGHKGDTGRNFSPLCVASDFELQRSTRGGVAR